MGEGSSSARAAATPPGAGCTWRLSEALRERGWAEMGDAGLTLTDPDDLLESWANSYKPPQGEEIRRKTGVLTETPALYERLSAFDNLHFFGILQGISEVELSQRINELLEFFELSSRAKDKVETFSKGMKQRLALARALIHKPPLLFLDEPTSGLDPEAAQQVNELIANLANQNGQTVVLATHNLTEAQRLCDRVAIMNKGKMLAIGSLGELSLKLWPATWVDIKFHKPPMMNLSDTLKAHRGVIQFSIENDALSVQVESKDIIPDVIRQLIQRGESIIKVNPRDYTLEDIYFALQAGGS